MKPKEEMIHIIKTFPPFPDIATQTIECYYQTEGEFFDIEIVKKIERYQDWNEDLLLLANSGFFNPGDSSQTKFRDIRSIEKDTLLQIILFISVIRWLKGLANKKEFSLWRFWDHCLAVAFAAPEIANLLQVKPPTFSFLSGFLHDYGKAIIEKRLSLDTSVILELVTTEQIPVDEAETRLIGIDHAEIGAMIFEKWNFPQPIVDAVRWHHKPGLYPGDSLLVNFIHIADAIALSMGIGPKDEGLQYRISSEILSRLNFNTRKIESLICIVQEEMENLKSFFTPMIGEKRMLPLNVLIVIDSKFVPPVLSKTLEMAEIAVKKLHIARNGMEGLNLLRSQPVDIVFTDIRMPVMDGIEMIGAMHEDEKLKQIPVIVFSSEESQNRIDELKSLGVGSYLRKPFSSETIANTIREALEFSTRVGR